jgi:hypothetical protein
MGFSVSIYSHPYIGTYTDNMECHNHNPGYDFYTFVSSFEKFGGQSILIQSGQLFGIDLSPFAKLVYTWYEVDEKYIESNLQEAAFLLALASLFLSKITEDTDLCDKITYASNEAGFWPLYFTQGKAKADLERLIAGITCFMSKGATKVYLVAG